MIHANTLSPDRLYLQPTPLPDRLDGMDACWLPIPHLIGYKISIRRIHEHARQGAAS